MIDTLTNATTSKTSAGLPVVALGQGYDTFAGAARSTAVSGETGRGGAASKLKYTLCRGASHFDEAINISADISAGMEFFDEVSAKATLYQSLELTETSVSIVLYASHSEASEFTSVALAVPPPTETAAADFFAGYGDCFVASIETGGEFIAIYTFYTESLNAQFALTEELSASGLTEEGEIDASLASKIQVAYEKSKSRRRLSLHLTGYEGKKAPNNIKEIIEFAQTIFGLRADAPSILNYSMAGYETVPGFPRKAWDTIKNNRRLFRSAPDGLAASRSQLRLLQNQIAAILTVYRGYGVQVDQADLTAKYDSVKGDNDALRAVIDNIDQDPTAPATAPDLHTLAWGMPSLTYSQIQLPGWGGTGGGYFADVSYTDVPSGVRISSLQLKGKKVIDRITTSYVSAEGGAPFTRSHGKGGGDDSSKLDLPEGLRLLKISGTKGWFDDDYVVSSLSFAFEQGLSLAYPPGSIRGDEFSHVFKVDEALIGFSGREGDYLDQLLLVAVKFAPVTWQKRVKS